MMRHLVGWSVPALAMAGLFAIQVLGAPFGLTLSFLVGTAVGVAAEVHGRLHPHFESIGDRFGLTLWILPGLLAGALGLAPLFLLGGDPVVLRALPLIGAAACGLAVAAQDREMNVHDNPAGWPKLLLSLLTYAGAFALFTMVYQTKERSLITATTMALLAALLSLVMLRGAPARRKRTMLYAGLIGLAAGEVTWALNYWVVLALVGGAVLLLVFYVLVGIVEGILHDELNRRLLVEYGSVGLLGFLLILSTGPWRP